ncbi:hypothetical protein Trydic_g4130 [Trypoxylus dichotomus]
MKNFCTKTSLNVPLLRTNYTSKIIYRDTGPETTHVTNKVGGIRILRKRDRDGIGHTAGRTDHQLRMPNLDKRGRSFVLFAQQGSVPSSERDGTRLHVAEKTDKVRKDVGRRMNIRKALIRCF